MSHSLSPFRRPRSKPIALPALVVSALAALVWASGVRAAATADSAAATPRTILSLPGKSWGVAMGLHGYDISINGTKGDGRRYVMASHRETGVNVSATLESAGEPATTAGCLAFLEMLAKSPLARAARETKLTTTSTLPSLEYTVQEFQGVKLAQRHVHLCYPKDDVYLDLHLSKVQFTPADEAHFRTFLDGVRIEPAPATTSSPSPTTARASGSALTLFKGGSEFYYQGSYQQAIQLYEQALDIEQANPQLDRIAWRILVNNLGIAYGISGKFTRARKIFEYGIQEDHTYPLFHYNLASTFAELNDRDQAMLSLRTAFRHRKNLNPGEPGLPDPRRDASFTRLMANDAFRKFLDRLMAQSS